MTRVTSDVEALHEVFTSGVVMILADLVKLAGDRGDPVVDGLAAGPGDLRHPAADAVR